LSDKQNAENKPFYKKTWFFIVVGVLFLGGLSSTISGEDETSQESSDDSSASTQSNNSEQETSDLELQMPEVIGLSGRAADSSLGELGFEDVGFVDLSEEDRTVLVTSNWQVCSSSPAKGEMHLNKDEVVLFVVKEDEDCNSPNEPEQEFSGPITSPDQLEAELTAFLGESTNRDTPREVMVSQPLSETPWYRISFEVNDSLFGSVQDVALKDFREIFPIIERAEFVEEVSFVAKYPLIDNTGQVLIEEVVDLYFSPDVFEKIVIENVTSEMFLESATEVYIHPALMDE
jgi:hypothetical protein